jgi:LDH2 family malate/lactate/ureidoglycolate dehydrogenase
VGAWKIDGFREVSEFKNSMDLWIQRFRSTKPLNDQHPVQIPGDFEREEEKRRLKGGIPLVKAVCDNLQSIAQEFNLPLEINP